MTAVASTWAASWRTSQSGPWPCSGDLPVTISMLAPSGSGADRSRSSPVPFALTRIPSAARASPSPMARAASAPVAPSGSSSALPSGSWTFTGAPRYRASEQLREQAQLALGGGGHEEPLAHALAPGAAHLHGQPGVADQLDEPSGGRLRVVGEKAVHAVADRDRQAAAGAAHHRR